MMALRQLREWLAFSPVDGARRDAGSDGRCAGRAVSGGAAARRAYGAQLAGLPARRLPLWPQGGSDAYSPSVAASGARGDDGPPTTRREGRADTAPRQAPSTGLKET